MGRWTDYFHDPRFSDFWQERLEDPAVRVLVIFGLGFDPRSLAALNALAALDHSGRVGYLALRIIAPPVRGTSGNTVQMLSNANRGGLARLTNCRREAELDIETQDAEGHSIAGRRTLEALASVKGVLAGYTDIVVDISGMPRGMFFPLISYVMKLADQALFRNLHVAVAEDAVLDGKTAGREYGVADYLHTFRHHDEGRLIWLPVIGASEAVRLDKIHNKIKSGCIEICPIVPFPASSLRRVDDIVVKHSEMLFEGFVVSPDNLILCDERTPFDIYRKILEVDEYYHKRLGSVPEIGKITTVVSPLTSKTLSLGMLLAAIERSLPVCHVEPGSYQVELTDAGQLVGGASWAPQEFWLTGEPYES